MGDADHSFWRITPFPSSNSSILTVSDSNLHYLKSGTARNVFDCCSPKESRQHPVNLASELGVKVARSNSGASSLSLILCLSS